MLGRLRLLELPIMLGLFRLLILGFEPLTVLAGAGNASETLMDSS